MIFENLGKLVCQYLIMPISSALLICSGTVIASNPASGAQGEVKLVESAEAADNAAGRELFQTNCALCHEHGHGEAPLIPALKKLTSAHIYNVLNFGVMASQAGHLLPSERLSIASYLGSEKADLVSVSRECKARAASTVSMSPLHVGNWGAGIHNERAIKESLITGKNVERLSLEWVFAFPNSGRARSQPTVAGDTLFVGGQDGKLYAIDLTSGCLLWDYQVEAEIRSAISVDVDEEGKASRLYFGDFKANVYGYDIKTKKLLWKKKADSHLNATLTGSLTLHKNTLFVPISSLEIISAINPKYECCTFRGSILSLNKMTGETIWQTYTGSKPVPQGKNSAGVIRYGPSGAPIWSTPTVDVKRGRIYFGTGENYTHPTSDTSDAIIALSMTSGAVAWVNQVTPNDAWNGACGLTKVNCPENFGPDFDFGAPPILTVGPSGKDIILAGQKSGRVYAFDPDDGGKLLWQNQVGRGGIMGGVHWGMASDRERVYVGISDTSVYQRDAHKPAKSGMHALDIYTGKTLWSELTEANCDGEKWKCSAGISAAVTVVPGVVFGGGLDGMLRAFDVSSGAVLWEVDTRIDYGLVNGIEAKGGSIDSDGPIIVGDRLLINSGYDKWGLAAGNVLLSFKVKPSTLNIK